DPPGHLARGRAGDRDICQRRSDPQRCGDECGADWGKTGIADRRSLPRIVILRACLKSAPECHPEVLRRILEWIIVLRRDPSEYLRMTLLRGDATLPLMSDPSLKDLLAVAIDAAHVAGRRTL